MSDGSFEPPRPPEPRPPLPAPPREWATPPTVPEGELSWSFARSSGPGGQNVNKVNSKAVLRWDVSRSPSISPGVKERFLAQFKTRITTGGELVLHGERYRDAPKNQQDLRERLQEMLTSVAAPPKIRRPRKVSRAAKQRRLDAKKQQSDKKRGRTPPSY